MRFAILVPLAILATPAFAQQTDEQLWLSATASTSVGGGTRVTLESIGRFSDRAGGFFHDEFGVAVSRPISKKVELLIGYRHVDDYDHGVAKPNDERLRQQLTFNFSKSFATRLRFEQRFNSSGSEIGFRLRPQVRFTLPVGGKGLALFATQEHFINLNTTSWGQRGGYERMRNAAGISIPLSPRLKGDIGYLNQYRFGRGGARDQMDSAVTFSLTLTLDGVFAHHTDSE
jgi:hypothetical protein